ncbi:MAG: hypothetical protein RIF41_00280, partial [Polyangiaceae bacterium]
FCKTCAGPDGFASDGTVEEAMPTTYRNEADAILAVAHGFPDFDGAEVVAAEELEEALPRPIFLNAPRRDVVDAALEALHRYKAHQEVDPVEALPEVARWFDGDDLADSLPAWLGEGVRTSINRERALGVLLRAFNRVTERLERHWLYAKELEQFEPGAVEQVFDLMEWPNDSTRSLGKLLSDLQVRPGEKKLGVKKLRRGAGGVRWEFVSPPKPAPKQTPGTGSQG